MATALGPYDARCGVLLKQDWYRNESLGFGSHCLGHIQLYYNYIMFNHILLYSSSGLHLGAIPDGCLCVIQVNRANSSHRLAGTRASCFLICFSGSAACMIYAKLLGCCSAAVYMGHGGR